ncbi:MAG: major facilitator superfamily 1 [Pelosinus sp.]|nr:major facilitator superfamily 1 [Pelosinus sp.]
MYPKLSPLHALFLAQFLSAFVDNMLLFIALGIIIRDGYPGYYLPLVQSTFLFSYIILSPWVGRFADKKAKSLVLMIGNVIKMLGVLLLLGKCDPALSYGVVGIGAVIYSPAKYGILPFLARGEEPLLRANSSLESYTIVAILTGSVAGGYLSDISISFSLLVCIVLYGLSIGVNTLIPKDPGNRGIQYSNAIKEFARDTTTLFQNKQSHYSLIGTGSFWMASAVLRMIIFAWVPLTLGISSRMDISMIIAVTGIGIAIGAVITPYLITVREYQRTAWYGLGMGMGIMAFLFIKTLPVAIIFLLLVGCMGGIFIVPMNACLQNVGHNTLGAGKAIAIQNFVENSFMFLGVGAYTLALKSGVSIYTSLAAAGMGLLAFVAYLILLTNKGKKN